MDNIGASVGNPSIDGMSHLQTHGGFGEIASAHQRMRFLELLYARARRAEGALEHVVTHALLEALRSDDNAVVRHEAAFILGQFSERLGDDEQGVIQALMAAAAQDVSTVVRHEAIEALGWFQRPQVVVFVATLVESSCHDVKDTAIVSLGRLTDVVADS